FGGGAGFRGSGGPGASQWGNQRAGGGFSAETGDFGGIFDDLFGGRSRRAPPPKGANVAYRLTVGFVEAATLAPQRITLSNGTSIDLKLPKGVETGTQMRLTGKGEAGPGGAGDATVSIEIRSHAFFRRDGADVRIDLPITLAEAVAGAKVKVPTVDGPVMLGVPAGSSSGKVLRLKGKGFTRKDGTRGDQLVSLLIDVPSDDAALAAFVEGWGDGRNVRAALGV
ncbi:MAG: J domain-containing protein, partial [Sphingopyxis sp.]